MDKGRAFEDLVELWLSTRGLAYERRARVQTLIGYIVEVDFLVRDSRGVFIVEAKNLEKPVDRDVVLKAWSNASSIRAYKAVVVSASGFTESAVMLARKLGNVELYTLDDVMSEIEYMRLRPEAPYIEPAMTPFSALKRVEGSLAEKRFFIFKAERGESVEAAYIPLYYVRLDVPVGRNKYVTARLLASALTGLPIAYGGPGRLYEALEALASVPRDVVEVYRVYAGKRVSRIDIVNAYGESLWVRLMRHLAPRGLVMRLSERPLTVELINIYPRIEDLEKPVETIEQAPKRVKPLYDTREPLYSPGSVRMFLEAALAAKVKTINTVYAPIFKVKLVDNKGAYRHVNIAGWIRDLTVYETKYI